jgi:hypothetical protein
MFGADPDRMGYLENPQHAAFVPLQEPVSVLASYIPHTQANAGMKQYKCGRTQPLLSGRNLKGLRQIIYNNYDIINTIISNYDKQNTIPNNKIIPNLNKPKIFAHTK